MKDNKIDYTKLNNRIVEQANSSIRTMSESEKRKLIEEKLERAVQYHKSLKETFGY